MLVPLSGLAKSDRLLGSQCNDFAVSFHTPTVANAEYVVDAADKQLAVRDRYRGLGLLRQGIPGRNFELRSAINDRCFARIRQEVNMTFRRHRRSRETPA